MPQNLLTEDEREKGRTLGLSVQGMVVRASGAFRLQMVGPIHVLACVQFIPLPARMVLLDATGKKAPPSRLGGYWISVQARGENYLLVEAKALPLRKK